MDGILIVGFLLLFVSIFVVYLYLVETNKIKPHVPAPYSRQTIKEQRGQYYDAVTKKFYTWDKLMELHETRKENRNDTISK